MGSVKVATTASAHSANYVENGLGTPVTLVSNKTAGSTFILDATRNNTAPAFYNVTGQGGSDSFYLFGGSGNTTFAAEGAGNDSFYIFTGNGTNSFSIITGANSRVVVVQDNPQDHSGVLTLAVTAGPGSYLYVTGNETYAKGAFTHLPRIYNLTAGAVNGVPNAGGVVGAGGPAYYSFLLGSGSVVDLGAPPTDDEGLINIVF